MRKHVLIEAILVMIILGIGFWNFHQQQENVSLRNSLATQEEKRKAPKETEEDLRQENEKLSKKAVTYSESLKKMHREEANNGENSDINGEFIDIVTKLFEANLNFTPENFADKKKEVSSYLSEELSKKYFGQKRNTYKELNDTTSELEFWRFILRR